MDSATGWQAAFFGLLLFTVFALGIQHAEMKFACERRVMALEGERFAKALAELKASGERTQKIIDRLKKGD